jgi:hypothetical protein
MHDAQSRTHRQLQAGLIGSESKIQVIEMEAVKSVFIKVDAIQNASAHSEKETVQALNALVPPYILGAVDMTPTLVILPCWRVTHQLPAGFRRARNPGRSHYLHRASDAHNIESI